MKLAARFRNHILTAALGMTAATAHAANLTWNGAASNLWSGSNWTGGMPANSGTDALFFQGSTNLANSNNLTGYTAAGTAAITFNSGAGSFVLGGNGIALEGNIVNNSSSLQTINLDLAISAVRSVTTNSGGGNVTLGGNISGAGGLSLTSAGILTLSGSNTYSGGTTLSASGAVLRVSSNNALGTGGITFGSLGSLQAVDNDVTLANSGTYTLLTVSGSQSITFTGKLTGLTGGSRDIANNISAGKSLTLTNIDISAQASTRALTITGTGNTNVVGTIANGNATNGQLTITNTGLTTLSGTNTYTSLTTVSAGTLVFAKTSALYNSNTANWTAGRIAVASGATLAFNVGGAGEFTTGNVTTLLTNLAASSAANNGMNAGAILGFDTSNAALGTFTIADIIADTTGASGGARGLAKLGSGALVLSASNSYTGGTTLKGGAIVANSASSLGAESGALTFAASGTLQAGAGYSTSRNTVVNAGATASIDTQSFALAQSGVTSGSGNIVKLGSGTLALTGSNSVTGSATVNAGTLLVSDNGSINSISSASVNGAGARFRYDSTAGLSRNVTVNGGGAFAYNSAANYSGVLTLADGRLEGTNWNGSLGNLTIGANQVISPGNSPGTAVTTSQTWAGAGAYNWEINQATGGTAGSDPGWDLITLTGDLTVSATSGNTFAINVLSLGLDNLSGDAAGFDAALSYNWIIADAANAIIGFSADKFSINTGGFTNDFDGTFAVALGDTAGIGGDNTQIYLTYTAVPEPSALALLGLAAGTALLIRRRSAAALRR